MYNMFIAKVVTNKRTNYINIWQYMQTKFCK